MLDNSLLKDLSNRLAALLPAAEHLRSELRTNIEQVLKKGLADLDVLSREEFAAQAEALERAQQRITELEGAITELEARIDGLGPTDS